MIRRLLYKWRIKKLQRSNFSYNKQFKCWFNIITMVVIEDEIIRKHYRAYMKEKLIGHVIADWVFYTTKESVNKDIFDTVYKTHMYDVNLIANELRK